MKLDEHGSVSINELTSILNSENLMNHPSGKTEMLNGSTELITSNTIKSVKSDLNQAVNVQQKNDAIGGMPVLYLYIIIIFHNINYKF